MSGSISLPQAVLELEEQDRKAYEALQPPKSMVLRYSYMRLIAELPYDGKDKPGCGSKLVIRTDRGTEVAEMLTTTCPNSACAKSVTRKEMLDYIDRSGGRNFPFTTQGRVLRLASVEDLIEQQRLDSRKPEILRFARAELRRLDLAMKLVDVELLLGGERIIFHYTSEQWVDFRELVKTLAGEYQTRIEMHQVSARDEARIVADYERCGQHCCCRQFLKVLKPVSMRMAKVQKATLDPAKISGRCGRLMCCLRYEDETYETLRKRLPRRQSRVLTPDGPGTVLDGQILTQLVLIRLDRQEAPVALTVEEIENLPPDQDPLAGGKAPPQPGRGEGHRTNDGGSGGDRPSWGNARPVSRPVEEESAEATAAGEPVEKADPDPPPVSRGYRGASSRPVEPTGAAAVEGAGEPDDESDGRDPVDDGPAAAAEASAPDDETVDAGQDGGQGGDGSRRRRRRRRRRRGSRGGGTGGGGGGNPGGA